MMPFAVADIDIRIPVSRFTEVLDWCRSIFPNEGWCLTFRGYNNIDCLVIVIYDQRLLDSKYSLWGTLRWSYWDVTLYGK